MYIHCLMIMPLSDLALQDYCVRNSPVAQIAYRLSISGDTLLCAMQEPETIGGGDVSQAVIPRFPTAAARVRTWVTSCRTSCGQSSKVASHSIDHHPLSGAGTSGYGQ